MAFTESIKKEVKEKAAFRCCRCQSIGVEVHHIIPQANGGPDTIDNAAPLCPSCHADFGNNTEKRKEITHMRDWWYQRVERQYPDNTVSNAQLEDINTKLENIRNNQLTDLDDLKTSLRKIANVSIDNITAGTAQVTASGIVNTAAFSQQLADNLHANVHCKNCGTRIGLLIGSNNCPNCKTPLN